MINSTGTRSSPHRQSGGRVALLRYGTDRSPQRRRRRTERPAKAGVAEPPVNRPRPAAVELLRWRTRESCRRCKLRKQPPWRTKSHQYDARGLPPSLSSLSLSLPFPPPRTPPPWPGSLLPSGLPARSDGRLAHARHVHRSLPLGSLNLLKPRPCGCRRTQSCCSIRTARWRTGWRRCARRSG